MVNHPRATAVNLDTGEVNAEKTTDFQNFVDHWHGENVAAQGAGVCIAPPVGCGKPVEGFRDELSAREYKITGMCQTCQDEFEASLSEDEELPGL